MNKILKIENDIVIIGMNDGSVKECRLEDLNFIPQVGDQVEVYGNDSRIFVAKAESIKREDGINININNVNNAASAYQPIAGKVVNKLAYLLLCFFLGGLGIHKFYAGKKTAGIIYLVFCWTYIPAIISFFEFIGGLFKKADSNGNIII